MFSDPRMTPGEDLNTSYVAVSVRADSGRFKRAGEYTINA